MHFILLPLGGTIIFKKSWKDIPRKKFTVQYFNFRELYIAFKKKIKSIEDKRIAYFS